MRKLLAIALIGSMLFVVAMPAVSMPIDHTYKTDLVKKPELVYLNDAVSPSVEQVPSVIMTIYISDEPVEGVKTKVPTNNHSPPNIRALRC